MAASAHIRDYSMKAKLHGPALTWLLSSAIADVIITSSLAIDLSRRKSGFGPTDDVIRKIIRLTIQTGFITAFFTVLDVVSFLAGPRTMVYIIFIPIFPSSK